GGHALTGEAIALAYLVVAELDLVTDGGRRHRAGHELHAAGRAAAPSAAGGGDVDAGLVGRAEDRGAGRHRQRAPRLGAARVGEDRERDRHAEPLERPGARRPVLFWRP